MRYVRSAMRLLSAALLLIAVAASYFAWRWRGERDQAVAQRLELRESDHRRMVPAVNAAVAGRPNHWGELAQNPADGLWYVRLPAGRFQMGCPEGAECDQDERPLHEVEITTPFWIGETEVTQAAFEHVTKTNPSVFRAPDRPVENVLWEQSKNYCAAVGMRLPTEAEWEYAARAGDAPTPPGAWLGIKETQPVGLKAPNAWGLYDTQGNVWEWVSDWYAAGYYAASPARDPTGPSTSADSRKVARGGAWNSNARSARLSNRGWGGYSDGDDSATGFRCAGDWHH